MPNPNMLIAAYSAGIVAHSTLAEAAWKRNAKDTQYHLDMAWKMCAEMDKLINEIAQEYHGEASSQVDGSETGRH